MRTIWETCDDLTARLNTVNTELAAERALADDAYEVLTCGTTVEREAWMARYRKAREQ